jgi:hypothetical protein
LQFQSSFSLVALDLQFASQFCSGKFFSQFSSKISPFRFNWNSCHSILDRILNLDSPRVSTVMMNISETAANESSICETDPLHPVRKTQEEYEFDFEFEFVID